MARRLTQRQREWVKWTLLKSLVPTHLLSLDQAFVLLRVRGPIELLWKWWKMQGQVDEWQTQNEARILCEVSAKLLAVLREHWLRLLTCWDDPHRSTIGISQIVREEARRLSPWLL
jgi:hypothetical protein